MPKETEDRRRCQIYTHTLRVIAGAFYIKCREKEREKKSPARHPVIYIQCQGGKKFQLSVRYVIVVGGKAARKKAMRDHKEEGEKERQMGLIERSNCVKLSKQNHSLS